MKIRKPAKTAHPNEFFYKTNTFEIHLENKISSSISKWQFWGEESSFFSQNNRLIIQILNRKNCI